MLQKDLYDMRDYLDQLMKTLNDAHKENAEISSKIERNTLMLHCFEKARFISKNKHNHIKEERKAIAISLKKLKSDLKNSNRRFSKIDKKVKYLENAIRYAKRKL